MVEEIGVGGDVEENKVDEPVEDGAGEIRKPRVARTPKAPTAKESEEHLPLHANYRD